MTRMPEAILKKSFGPISALGARFKSSKYLLYSSGLNLAAALTLNPIEGFETVSDSFIDELVKSRIFLVLSSRRRPGGGAVRVCPGMNRKKCLSVYHPPPTPPVKGITSRSQRSEVRDQGGEDRLCICCRRCRRRGPMAV